MVDRRSVTAQPNVSLSEAVSAALRVAKTRGERVFIVGGVVRDLLMGRGIGDYDLDLVVEGDGLAFAQSLQGELGCALRQHPSFLTAKLVGPFVAQAGDGAQLSEVDVVTARSETYQSPGALPTVKPASIEEDLRRRDFSVNALALPLLDYAGLYAHTLAPEQVIPDLVDPTSGLADLQSKTLRVLHPESFIDDPTRLFRAVRYAVRLGFDFDLTTVAAFMEAVKGGALKTLSARRIWNEVVTAMDEECAAEIIEEFSARGLFMNLEVISANRLTGTVEALERLSKVRDEIEPGVFILAAKLILLVGLIEDGREDILAGIQESGKVVKRAHAVRTAINSEQDPVDLSELAASYALTGASSTRIALESLIHSGGE